MFSKPLPLFEEPKTNKSVFQREPEFLPCFELNYKFLERHKKTYFARDNEKARKCREYGPENGKQKFNQTTRRSNNRHVFTFQGTYLRFNRDVTLSVLSLGHFLSFSLEQVIWKFEKRCYR